MLFQFETTHPDTGGAILVKAEHFPARKSRDWESPDDPEEIIIKDVICKGCSIPFADFEADLEEQAFEEIAELNPNHFHPKP